jgi:(p)ppGpp synthase/HD superfamily hydrolase
MGRALFRSPAMAEHMPITREPHLNELIDKVRGYYPVADVDMIRRAHDFSAQVHKGQTRLSGEPYWCTLWRSRGSLPTSNSMSPALSAVFFTTQWRTLRRRAN